jgi:NifB/MoaA-like Fe-S oxidoreductase
VLTDTLRYASLKAARQLIEQHAAHRVLLLTSTMIRPILEHMLEKTQAFAGLEVAIRVVENDYFGGTINIGDLLVVEDFIRSIRRFQREEGDPELILLPASPFASSPWGRDLTGVPWHEIERQVGVPVDLIPCPNITF